VVRLRVLRHESHLDRTRTARVRVEDQRISTPTSADLSVVTADSLEAAAAMAKGCPTMTRGGGVEVAVLADLPAEHPAERIRAQRNNA
jgi:hypothetical protein